MDELIEILKEVKPGVDFEKEENLIEGEVLDSFDIVNLVSKLNSNFDIEISPADLVPENFKSAKAMYALIQKLQED